MNFGDVLTVTLTLFAVIDILGSIPIIIGLRSKMGHIQSEKATLVSGLIMIDSSISFILTKIRIKFLRANFLVE